MKILLAVDDSEFTAASLDLMARVPFPDGSAATVLTVVPDLELVPGQALDRTEAESVRKALAAGAERLVGDAAERMAAIGFSVTRAVRAGHVANQIVACAEETKADLIVVGSHGRRGVSRFLLGSASHKVVTFAPCSVLVVQPRPGAAPPPAPLQVLLATDGSEPAQAATGLLAGLSGRRWCDVRIVTVLELITVYHMELRQRLTESWRRHQAAARELVREAEETLSPIATSVRSDVLEAASPSEAILDAAEEAGADLIVLGATGRGRMERMLIGSVSNRVVRHARRPVLLARGR